MKDPSEVIQEFNELVNMTASELEKWLRSGDSQSAGWPKEGEDGESVGHDSGVKIVNILKSNPQKDPNKYTDEQIQHMRKVVSYCKRHLAQEEKTDDEKSAAEVKKTKSYASLKNWGHDVLKKRGHGDDEAEEEYDESDEKQTGSKRKKEAQSHSNANKKRETRKGEAEADGGGASGVEEEDEEEEDDEEEDDEDVESDAPGSEDDELEEEDLDEDEPKNGPQKGDTVSWSWGGGHPEGKVLDVKGEQTSVTTKRGNEVSRKGKPEDPAVVLDTGKSKAVKSSHELD